MKACAFERYAEFSTDCGEELMNMPARPLVERVFPPMMRIRFSVTPNCGVFEMPFREFVGRMVVPRLVEQMPEVAVHGGKRISQPGLSEKRAAGDWEHAKGKRTRGM